MPQIFSVGGYVVYFWSNEGAPLEPIHVHIAKGTPTKNGTKIWITSTGHTLVVNNKSNIPQKDLKIIRSIIEARSSFIEEMWTNRFGKITYYC